MWNYWVGGEDHFAADRVAAEQILAAMPLLPLIAQSVRRVLLQVVTPGTSTGRYAPPAQRSTTAPGAASPRLTAARSSGGSATSFSSTPKNSPSSKASTTALEAGPGPDHR
jgi:hypothetical protein